MKKIASVTLLPTDKVDTKIHIIWMNKSGQLLHTHSVANNIVPQHLYFTISEWTQEFCHYISGSGRICLGNPQDTVAKIVATTNPELWHTYADKLVRDYHPEKVIAHIPDSFIQTYIKAYNEGKPITQVMLEYDEVPPHISKDPFPICINSDGSVIWSVEEEKLYTRQDMMDCGFAVYLAMFHKEIKTPVGNVAYVEWFNKNYPQ